MASTISLIDRVSKRGLFLTSQHSEKRRIINGNFPMLSIWLFPPPASKRVHAKTQTHIYSSIRLWVLNGVLDTFLHGMQK